MANYVSKKFSSGEEFEAFLEKLASASGLSLTYSNGNINLKNENDTILGTIRLSSMVDGKTVKSDKGYIEVVGIREINNGSIFNMWVGTQEEYDKITERNTSTVYWITDDQTVTKLTSRIETLEEELVSLEDWQSDIINGLIVVPKATNARHAEEADYATRAGTANSALEAQFADRAADADHATTADNATNTAYAALADRAATANKADHATNATNAVNADHATMADSATNANHALTADTLKKGLYYHTTQLRFKVYLSEDYDISQFVCLHFSYPSLTVSPYSSELEFITNILYATNKVKYYDGNIQVELAYRQIFSYEYLGKSTNNPSAEKCAIEFYWNGVERRTAEFYFSEIEVKTSTVKIF